MNELPTPSFGETMAYLLTTVVLCAIAAYLIAFVITWFDRRRFTRIRFKHFRALYNYYPDGWEIYNLFVMKLRAKGGLSRCFSFSFLDALRYFFWVNREHYRIAKKKKLEKEQADLKWLIEQAKLDNAAADRQKEEELSKEISDLPIRKPCKPIILNQRDQELEEIKAIEKLIERL